MFLPNTVKGKGLSTRFAHPYPQNIAQCPRGLRLIKESHLGLNRSAYRHSFLYNSIRAGVDCLQDKTLRHLQTEELNEDTTVPSHSTSLPETAISTATGGLFSALDILPIYISMSAPWKLKVSRMLGAAPACWHVGHIGWVYKTYHSCFLLPKDHWSTQLVWTLELALLSQQYCTLYFSCALCDSLFLSRSSKEDV